MCLSKRMSDEQTPQGMSGGSLSALVIGTYLLSPFPVCWILARIFGRVLDAPEPVESALIMFYMPIILAAERWKPVGAFYDWGLDLLRVW
jgi:hypothetical protein